MSGLRSSGSRDLCDLRGSGKSRGLWISVLAFGVFRPRKEREQQVGAGQGDFGLAREKRKGNVYFWPEGCPCETPRISGNTSRKDMHEKMTCT